MWRQQLTSGKRVYFWGIVPICALMLGLMTLNLSDWTVKKALIVGALDFTFLCFSFGLYNPVRFKKAMGVAMAFVFLFYCVYVVDEFFLQHPATHARNRGEVSPLNAVMGLIFIGLPALSGAIAAFRAKKNAHINDPSPEPIHPS